MWRMLHIGRARHPGPGQRFFTPGQLSTEIVNVGGWLTHGDLALDFCAQFLAVAEHRLIPSRARSVVGVVSLGLVCLPPFLSHLLLLFSLRSFPGWAKF